MQLHPHATSVTPGAAGKIPTCSTVHDRQPRRVDACPTASRSRGDVGCTDDISVGGQITVWAGEVPSSSFGDLDMTARTRRGGPALVDELNGDASYLGFVLQRRDPLADAPVGDRMILSRTRVDVEQAARIPNHKRADAVFGRVVDHGLCGFVTGLSEPSSVTRL
jgi:hypothetical protein